MCTYYGGIWLWCNHCHSWAPSSPFHQIRIIISSPPTPKSPQYDTKEVCVCRSAASTPEQRNSGRRSEFLIHCLQSSYKFEAHILHWLDHLILYAWVFPFSINLFVTNQWGSKIETYNHTTSFSEHILRWSIKTKGYKFISNIMCINAIAGLINFSPFHEQILVVHVTSISFFNLQFMQQLYRCGHSYSSGSKTGHFNSLKPQIVHLQFWIDTR